MFFLFIHRNCMLWVLTENPYMFLWRKKEVTSICTFWLKKKIKKKLGHTWCYGICIVWWGFSLSTYITFGYCRIYSHGDVLMIFYFMSLSTLFAMERSWWLDILCLFQHYLSWRGQDDLVLYVSFYIICHGEVMMSWYFMSLSTLFAMERSWWFGILCPFQHYLPWKVHDDLVFYVPFNIICHGKFMMI